MSGLSDVQLGVIAVVALLLVASVIGGKPGGKEVREEAHKKLVGKLAEDKATADYNSIKNGSGKVLLIALLVGAVGYLVVSNMPAESETPATTVPDTTTTISP